MKLKTTKKAIKENTFNNLIGVGYCELQYLLTFKNAFAYSSGIYGWSCDYYELKNNGINYIISTGYSTIGQRLPREIVKSYENKAKDMINNGQPDYRKKLNILINKFLAEAEKYLNKN